MKLELIETLKEISLGLFAMELLKSKKKTTYKIPNEIINEYKFQCEVDCNFLQIIVQITNKIILITLVDTMKDI